MKLVRKFVIEYTDSLQSIEKHNSDYSFYIAAFTH